MNVSAASPRRFGILLIWVGGVAMVVMATFALAWWKLPEWKPRWVIDHSPWVEPTVRAMVVYGAHHDSAVARALDWGPAIGPVLRRRFAEGSENERWGIMSIARSLVKKAENLKDVTAIQDVFRRRRDGSRLSEAEAVELRDHVRGLARDACAAGGDYPDLARDIMVAVYEPDFGPVLWKLAAERLSQHDLSYVTDGISHVRDPRAVRGLMPLFINPVEESDRIYLGGAMRDSLAKDQVAEVVAAMRHEHPKVRLWGVHAIWWVDPNDEARALLPLLMADPDPEVRHEALDAALFNPLTPELLARLLACLRDDEAKIRKTAVEGVIVGKVPPELRADFLKRLDDPVPEIRLKVIEAIATLRLVDGGSPLAARLEPAQESVLRRIAGTVGDPARGAAIVVLGRIGDITDFPLLLGLLQDDDREVARNARNAIFRLPLTPEQRQQVDAVWDAVPTSAASPPIP